MLSVSLLLAGMALLVASFAPLAGGAEISRGGTLRFVYPPEGVGPDPQASSDYRILNATQLTLYAFPDVEGATQILPAAAAGLPVVSKDGRTYTITIRPGFRFSDGEPVAARNFAVAFNRLFNPKLGSGNTFLFDDVVGAVDMLEGRDASVSGVSVTAGKLRVRLRSPRPDFLVRLTNTSISATPLDMPIVRGGVLDATPSAGPYYLKEHVRGLRAIIARNPFWRRDVLPWRPANVDRIVFERPGLRQVEAIQAVERNEIDVSFVPESESPRLLRRYGVNRGRLFVKPRPIVWYYVFNLDRPLFRQNPKLRQAVNFAMDRPELVRQLPVLSGRRTDQILPPGLPGYRDWDLYPLKGPNLRKARALARGNLRGGKAVLYSIERASLPFAPGAAEILRFNLAKIGLDVEIKTFPGITRRMVTPGEPWDIGLAGYFADYPDPSNFINTLFDGRNIRPGDLTGLNFARFDDAGFNTRMRRAALLAGDRRLETYAAIERDLLRHAAPVAPFVALNGVYLVSNSVGCFSHHVLGVENVVAICKK